MPSPNCVYLGDRVRFWHFGSLGGGMKESTGTVVECGRDLRIRVDAAPVIVYRRYADVKVVRA